LDQRSDAYFAVHDPAAVDTSLYRMKMEVHFPRRYSVIVPTQITATTVSQAARLICYHYRIDSPVLKMRVLYPFHFK
jgi:hypothetical protein